MTYKLTYQFIYISFLKSSYSVCVCMYVCVFCQLYECRCMYMLSVFPSMCLCEHVEVSGGLRITCMSQFFLSTMWVVGIELRSSNLVANTFIWEAILPALKYFKLHLFVCGGGACNACIRRQFAGQFSAWESWGLNSGQISGLVTHHLLTEPSSRTLLIILISFWLKWFFCFSILFHWFLVWSLLFPSFCLSWNYWIFLSCIWFKIKATIID